MSAPVKADRIARYLALIEPAQAPSTLEEMAQRLADGESLSDVCRGWDVPYGRVMAWLMFDEGRYAVYRRALEIAAHELVSQALAIADEQRECVRENGTTFDPDVPRDKLRIETRLRIAKAHAPRTYGDRDGAGAGGGLTVVVNRFNVSAEDDGPAVTTDGKRLVVH